MKHVGIESTGLNPLFLSPDKVCRPIILPPRGDRHLIKMSQSLSIYQGPNQINKLIAQVTFVKYGDRYEVLVLWVAVGCLDQQATLVVIDGPATARWR